MRTCFSLGANFQKLLKLVDRLKLLQDRRLSLRARVCMCVHVFRGCDRATIQRVVNVSQDPALKTLTKLVREGIVSRYRQKIKGAEFYYHGSQQSQKIVREEIRRFNESCENLVNELRQHPRIKLDKLDKLLGIVPDVES